MVKSKEVLEKELTESKIREEKLKSRIGTLREVVLEDRKYKKTLINQYESVIKEKQKMINDYKNNIVKMFIFYLFQKFSKKGDD